jgi:hypothetical protein
MPDTESAICEQYRAAPVKVVRCLADAKTGSPEMQAREIAERALGSDTAAAGTPSEDLSVLHRRYEILTHWVNIIDASIDLTPEQQSRLADLKRGQMLVAPSGHIIIRRR